MSAIAKIRVMLVDNHPIVREGLSAILERTGDIEVVAEASSGVEAVRAWHHCRPDVTLTDLRMPTIDGIQVIAAVRKEFPNARFVILSTYDGDEFIYRAFQAGAKAYVLKDAPREQLLEAISAAHQGRTYITPAIAAQLAAHMTLMPLTPRESEVLKCLVAGSSNLEIANELFVSESTIKSHVNSILAKMRVSDRTQAVISALRRGLVTLE